MLNINALHEQVFTILKCEVAADIMAEGCRMDIGWKDLAVS